jgi:hypothetical protein
VSILIAMLHPFELEPRWSKPLSQITAGVNRALANSCCRMGQTNQSCDALSVRFEEIVDFGLNNVVGGKKRRHGLSVRDQLLSG